MTTSTEPVRIRTALISVYRKDGVVELARELHELGVKILTTGGTARLLREQGIAIVDVSSHTGFPEMMDGRVKTLHPKIHGGLLMRRDREDDRQEAASQGIEPIDLVVVNLYPFGEFSSRPDATPDQCIEMIDIGGPSMIRSAAKNHAFVTVVTDPSDYPALRAELAANDGSTTMAVRRHFARQAFTRTSAYDAAIAGWMTGDAFLPDELVLSFRKRSDLRYGENPHQRAALYVGTRQEPGTVAWADSHGGKELSFNNYLDAAAAWDCVQGLGDTAAVVVKHKNPCGAAIRPGRQLDAFIAAYEGDPLSAYGGILAFDRPLEAAVARAIAVPEHFFEVIVAPSYEDDAIEILRSGAKWGKNCRILEVGSRAARGSGPEERELRWIHGGVLVQDPNPGGLASFAIATQRLPSDREHEDLRFAWAVCPHVTSNAIVFARDRRLIGVGAGQMSRVDAVAIAARKGGAGCEGAVMASDAFFPFADGIVTAYEAGIRAVIQPGGSIRDKDVIQACDERGIAMVLTGRRHFRH